MAKQHVGVDQIAQRLATESTDSSYPRSRTVSVTPNSSSMPPAAPRRVGTHRSAAPSGAVRSRAAVVAVAAGASFAAYQAEVGGFGLTSAAQDDLLFLAADDSALGGAGSAAHEEISDEVTWTDPSSQPIVAALYEGQTTNAEREIAEELDRRPEVHAPAMGRITSGYGPRWGSFHGGIDIANEVNTPIWSATDGTVIDSGAAQGYGQWIRVLSDDGVMTVYGHLETLLVNKGDRVHAGQHIAGMGNRGFSTGTHLHFEVWINDGTERINPMTWFQQSGMNIESAIGPIQAGAENLTIPGLEGSADLVGGIANAIIPDPANNGSGAPGLKDAIQSTAQTTSDPNQSRELENIAQGRPAAVVGDPLAAPMGPVVAARPAQTATDGAAPIAVPSLGAVAP